MQQQRQNKELYKFPSEKGKGVVGTIIFHLVIVALLLFTGFHQPNPPPEEEGILVNFGYDDTGSGLMEPAGSSSAAEESSPPDEGITDPIADEITEEVTASVQEVTETVEETLTQDFEEAPVIEKKVEQPDPVEEARKKAEAEKVRLQKLEEEKIRKAQEEADRIRKAEEEAERIRQAEIEAERIRQAEEEARIKKEAEDRQRRLDAINTRTKNALSNAQGTGTGENQGVAGGEGNQGVETGAVGVNRYGDGSGTGTEGVSFDLAGRQASELSKPKYDSQSEGKVVVEVRVDRNGNVISATAGVKGSTTLEEYFLRVAREAAMTTKFDRKPDAPAIQKGTITYHFILR